MSHPDLMAAAFNSAGVLFEGKVHMFNSSEGREAFIAGKEMGDRARGSTSVTLYRLPEDIDAIKAADARVFGDSPAPEVKTRMQQIRFASKL